MKKLNLPILYRSLFADKPVIDEEARTVELSFSSEAAVDRGWGIEVLDHRSSSVRMDRIADGAHPLLLNHNSDQQIGVVQTARLENGRGVATVRFGSSALAKEIFEDVKDGIRRLVSVGYRIFNATQEKDGDKPVYRVTDWMPMEVSIVSLPADPGVGIGRDLSGETYEVEINEQDTMKRNILLDPASGSVGSGGGGSAPTTANPPAANGNHLNQAGNNVFQVDRIQILQEGARLEQARISEIRAVAKKVSHLVPEAESMADRAVASLTTTPQEFTAQIFARMQPSQPVNNPDPLLGMSTREVREYSFVRAIEGLANGTLDGIELEAHNAAVKQYGSRMKESKHGRGKSIIIPDDVLRQSFQWMQRDQLVGTGSLGGNLVATNLLAGSFIDLLRNKMALTRLGATYLDGLVGDVAIPRQATAGSVTWASAETTAVTEGSLTLNQVTMTPKQIHARQDFSWKLLLQSTPNIEALVRSDLASIIALAIDLAAIHGSGASGQPAGLATLSGIGSVAGGTDGGAPDWADMVGLETEVATDNADVGNLAYLTNAKVRGKLKTTEKASATGQFVWTDGQNGEGFINGYRAVVSNQVSSALTKGTTTGTLSAVFFGNWRDVLLGSWSGLELHVNPFSQMANRIYEVHAFQAVDVAFRHPESFAAMLDAST